MLTGQAAVGPQRFLMPEQPPPTSNGGPPRKWRSGVPADPRKKSDGRGLQLFVLVALLLAVLGAALAWVFYPSPWSEPGFLSLAVREYESLRLPPNALALQDSDLL